MAKHTPPAKLKIPARVVPSDDFEIVIDGQVYHPHEGEQVEVDPVLPVSALKLAQGGLTLGVKLDALKNEAGELDPAAAVEWTGVLTGHYDELTAFLAPLIWGWTWTDRRGRPLAQPDGTPAALSQLSEDELYYLWLVVQRRNPAARKNA